MIDINDTMRLIAAAEQIKPPATYLVDIFFPTRETNLTDKLSIEYRRRGREKLAPYVVEGASGVSVSREGSKMFTYQPPIVAPRRLITQRDVSRRAFGEQPLYSTVSVEERAMKIQSDDLFDMITMIKNRQEQMASELLSTGKITAAGYADDGFMQRIDEIRYEWAGDFPIDKDWDDASASIFDDLQSMSETIQEEAGVIPPLLVVGKNVAKYLRKNKEMLDWLMVPRRENLTVATFEPHYVTPQVQYIGNINALGLEVVSYNVTYTADDGTLKPYVGPDDIIMGVPGLGSIQFGVIPLINDAGTGFEGYAAEYVPQYITSKQNNTMSLTLWSRFILVPEVTGRWIHACVKG